LDQRGDDFGLQRNPGLRVPEERGHRDQEVLEQALRLRRMRLQEVEVLRDAHPMRELHAPGQASQYGGSFVFREIVPRPPAQRVEHGLEGLLLLGLRNGLALDGRAKCGFRSALVVRECGQLSR